MSKINKRYLQRNQIFDTAFAVRNGQCLTLGRITEVVNVVREVYVVVMCRQPSADTTVFRGKSAPRLIDRKLERIFSELSLFSYAF